MTRWGVIRRAEAGPTSRGRLPRVLVLNHAAVADGDAGGTRHVELFGYLDGWRAEIVASDRNLLTRRRQARREPGFRTVPTLPYRGSGGAGRVANWVSYAVGAVVVGLLGERPDVVYASSPQPLALAAGLVVARLRRSRLVVEVRDLWPEYMVQMGQVREGGRVHRAMSAFESHTYRRAAVVVVLAEGVGDRVRASGARRVEFLPNAADLERFDRDRRAGADRASWRRRLGVAPGAFVAMYVGNHGPVYGLENLLSAAGELAAEGDDTVVVLVGDGTRKAALREQAAARGLANVVFVDPVPKSEVPGLLGAADVGLHVLADVALFRFGVSPNKVYDYFAASLPVVTNCPGAVGALVEGAGAGVAVAPEALADGVRSVRARPAAGRRALGTAGREYLEQGRSRRHVADRLAALLDEVAR